MIRAAVRIAVALAAVVTAERLVVGPARCNRAVRSIESATRIALQQPRHTALVTARTNIEALEYCAGRSQPNFDIYILLALNKNLVGRSEEAISDLTRALAVADRPEIYFDRGLIHLQAGRFEQAMSDLTLAAEFNPTLLHPADAQLRELVWAELEKRKRR